MICFHAMGSSAWYGAHYGPRRMIWFRTMDHGTWSGPTILTIAHDLVPHYGPRRTAWFHTMDYGTWSGSTLWTTAHDLVPHYGSRRMIWFHSMDHGAWSSSTLWITAHDLVLTPHTIDPSAWNGSILRIIAHDLVPHGPPRWSGSTLWTTAHDLVLHMDHGTWYGSTLWTTAHYLVPCYGPWRMILYHAMGHGAWAGSTLWSTEDTVSCYLPRCLIDYVSRRMTWLHALGHKNKLLIRISRGIEAKKIKRQLPLVEDLLLLSRNITFWAIIFLPSVPLAL